MLHKAVIIDGFPGCGKTMLSPIISSFERVEIMQYASLIENICELSMLNKIEDDVAIAIIRMNADLLIYNVSMGRHSNCRPSDLSSIFKHRPLEHIKRMLSPGDKLIPEKIAENKPILHITSHMLLPSHNLLFKALDEKLIFYEVVRHPLYMIIQHEKNFEMFNSARTQHVQYSINNNEYTFFTNGWEEIFNKSNNFEKAIFHMKWYFDHLFNLKNEKVRIIPFEVFVKEPSSYIENISMDLESPIDRKVEKEMKRQKVPRQLLGDGPDLKIYKRCGWEPPKYFSEERELKARRELVAMNVNKNALDILDSLSLKYEQVFLGN